MDSLARKTQVASLSVGSNTLLVILKLVIGFHIGAVSVVSEAVHSGVDLLAAVIALVAVRTAEKPADADHPFGHAKVENISGTVEALLIFAAAVWIVMEAVHKLRGTAPLTEAGWGVLVMLVSSGINLLVSRKLFKIGKQTDSIALQADAWHLRTDVYTSVGVSVGLGVILLGRLWLPGVALQWIDPAAAIVVALLIAHTAYRLTLQSARDLLDASLPKDEEAWICDYLARLRPTVHGFHKLRTRKAGAVRFVEFHLIVEHDMSVEDAHRISDVMTCDIEERFPGCSVTIHVEPCDGVCKPNCIGGCLLTAEEREAVRRCHALPGNLPDSPG